jgi:DNA processing protein
LLSLASLRSFPPRKLFELAVREQTARGCVRAIRAGRAGGDADRARFKEISADLVAEGLKACGARLVTPSDDEYPRSLEDLADPPATLFVRGRDLNELFPRVALVGARRSSLLGDEVAKEIGAGLAEAGVTVVSGAARGIDTASHRGALAAGGATVAVLGCGIERAYPASNRPLLDRIAIDGAVISEYPPGVLPDAFRFPARNRIVAALAEAVVVVEGAAGSGSLITADHALDLGRSVFAVPGPVNSPLAEVPLALIREGAGMIRGADDLLVDLGRLDPHAGSAAPPLNLSTAEQSVLSSLAGPTLAETVARSLGWELPDTIAALVGLELRGLVRSVGGRFERRLTSSAG